MKLSLHKKILSLVVVMAVLLVGGAVTAYAASTSQSTKVGNTWVVDTVTAETTVDGIVVQTIERKWIPEDRYNSNDPRNPISTTTTTPIPPVDSKVQQLRNAGINSRNDLQTYGWNYQWSTTTNETYASDSKLETSITFQVDEAASADRWVCTFNQVVTFDAGGNPVVEYYIGSQKYSTNAIKRMFAQYGKAR